MTEYCNLRTNTENGVNPAAASEHLGMHSRLEPELKELELLTFDT